MHTALRRLLTASALALGVAGTSLAQTAEPVAPPTTSAYVTVDLQAGFALDPFLVSVNGGEQPCHFVAGQVLDRPFCLSLIHI